MLLLEFSRICETCYRIVHCPSVYLSTYEDVPTVSYYIGDSIKCNCAYSGISSSKFRLNSSPTTLGPFPLHSSIILPETVPAVGLICTLLWTMASRAASSSFPLPSFRVRVARSHNDAGDGHVVFVFCDWDGHDDDDKTESRRLHRHRRSSWYEYLTGEAVRSAQQFSGSTNEKKLINLLATILCHHVKYKSTEIRVPRAKMPILIF